MVATTGITISSLATRLANQVRDLAEQRDLDIDISLSGRPHGTTRHAGEALERVVDLVLESARSAEDIHHLALDIGYLADGLRVRLEHDAALQPEARARVEGDALAAFEAIGALGGGLSVSAGRGFGVRIEVTVPYTDSGARGPGIGDRILPAGPVPTPASGYPRSPVSILVERLTPQETTCLNLLATGLSNKEIARKMNLSLGTVKFHLAQIYQKLGVQGRGRGAAVARARELGLVFD